MKHNFSDTDIGRAGASAALKGGVAPTPVSTNFLKRFLDHLPEPDDEWQRCRFEDIQKGDRVKLVCKVGQLGGRPAVLEVDPEVVDPEYITWSRNNNLGVVEKSDVQAVYRIPSPHPDPEVHPVIANVAVDKPGTDVTHRYDYATWDADEYYDCWNHDGSYYGRWKPNTISEWEPAQVVPKVADDDR